MSIVLRASTESFSALGGLSIFDEMISASRMKKLVSPHLPKNVVTPRVTSFEKFKGLLLGFVADADCLDDLDKLAQDPGFDAACKNTCDARTYGRFLRSFQRPAIRQLNEKLTDFSLHLRSTFAKDADFVLDLDSTHHEQAGVKMEGVAYDYDSRWCLSSLQAFDQFGFQYWMDVREGNAYTANGATAAITQIFRKVPRRTRRYLRADSGYCNKDVFNSCYGANVKFVIAMRQNMLAPLLETVRHWQPNRRMHAKDRRPVEVATSLYRPVGSEETLRVMIMRAEKPVRPLFEDRYDYYAFITNIGHHEKRDEEILDFYRARGNAENYIKELKNGFDMHHFPCQKLNANRVYGIIAAFAHNLLRFASHVLADGKPRMAKRIRFFMVTVPCRVVRHARRVIFDINQTRKSEVEHWITKIHQHFVGSTRKRETTTDL